MQHDCYFHLHFWISKSWMVNISFCYPELILRRRPRVLPGGRWARTCRRIGSSLSLSTWWTRTCLSTESLADVLYAGRLVYPPLEIIRPGILVLLIRTEWTDITRRIMHQAMPHHFIFALEAFPTHATWTAFYRTEMRPLLGMDVRMRAVDVRRLCKTLSTATTYLRRY